MNKEELVSFETAKLLKEKGFDDFTKEVTSDYPFYWSCTQSLAQKWLRENYGIHINVDFRIGWGYQLIPVGWSGERFSEKFIDNKGWETYEETLEEGLKEGLKLLNNCYGY